MTPFSLSGSEPIFEPIVCQVHLSVLSQDVSSFSRGNLSKLSHQARSSWELVRPWTSSAWFLQFNNFCGFLPSLFWQRMNCHWILTFSCLIFPFHSRTVLKTREHLLSWTLSLLFQRIIERPRKVTYLDLLVQVILGDIKVLEMFCITEQALKATSFKGKEI